MTRCSCLSATSPLLLPVARILCRRAGATPRLPPAVACCWRCAPPLYLFWHLTRALLYLRTRWFVRHYNRNTVPRDIYRVLDAVRMIAYTALRRILLGPIFLPTRIRIAFSSTLLLRHCAPSCAGTAFFMTPVLAALW